MLGSWEVVNKCLFKGKRKEPPLSPVSLLMQSIFWGEADRQLQGVYLPDCTNLGRNPKAGHPVSLVVSNKMSVASPGSMKIN